MENIILIETSTELCSTAIACDGKIISSRESGTPRAHASLTAVFIADMLRETGLGIYASVWGRARIPDSVSGYPPPRACASGRASLFLPSAPWTRWYGKPSGAIMPSAMEI